MAEQDTIHDSPTGWVNKHIQEYVETDGREGHTNYGVVASRGGHPQHPAWYLNLVDNPEVEVQVEADKFSARAHTATAEEKARLWPVMAAIWPAYDDYQTKTERAIPVVVLTREE
jgi:deazaflavin-dependent oxidoreductase (nitroreductase family)